MKKSVKKGYGKCQDCAWSLDENKWGCNVERDSEECRLNKKLIKAKGENKNE